MATVHEFYPDKLNVLAVLQEKFIAAEEVRRQRFIAIILLQRMARGYLIRKYISFLNKCATIIQCALRVYRAKKAMRKALRERVQLMHKTNYDKKAAKIQAAWRGYVSRKKKFCYYSFKRWLKTVKERGERKKAEAYEFRIRSHADDLQILENDARQWLAFVVFKLHHLLRTFVRAGVYSDPATNELTEFENLLNMVKFTEYMKKLRRKYDEFVRKHRPMFNNKRLFPVIGYGEDYWYMSLAEMYELTSSVTVPKNTRHIDTHHSSIHPKPFLWRKVSRPRDSTSQGPFYVPSSTKTPPPTPLNNVVASCDCHDNDPRFHLYVKHYKPEPNIFKYVDYHVNVIVNRRNEILHTDLKK